MQALRRTWLRIAPIMLVCMLFGALAPQGFMPRFGPEGFSITLCSGSSQRQVWISAGSPEHEKLAVLSAAMHDSGSDGSDGGDGSSMPPCLFAMSALAVILDVPLILAPPAMQSALPPALLAAIARSRHHAAKPPATGPPYLI